jgi:hypothetical protein
MASFGVLIGLKVQAFALLTGREAIASVSASLVGPLMEWSGRAPALPV